MIETPTVLVLGAGASMHVGYPLGGELVNSLCGQRNSELNNDLPLALDWTSDDVNRFLTRLSRAGHYSIDAFLESVPEQADLGKYLLARELKRHENIDKLFSPNDSGWYQHLFNRLLDNNNPSGFSSSCLSIITFNYDRSLKARFLMPSDEATEMLSYIPIIHVHGSLGDYPHVPYSSEYESSELLDISKKIQIIHEITEPESGFCNAEFEHAHELLKQAERVYFLGFGFHPDNIRRFRFFTPENTADLVVHATTRGMGAIDVAALATQLEPLGIKQRLCHN
jgi:hypothetical protein